MATIRIAAFAVCVAGALGACAAPDTPPLEHATLPASEPRPSDSKAAVGATNAATERSVTEPVASAPVTAAPARLSPEEVRAYRARLAQPMGYPEGTYYRTHVDAGTRRESLMASRLSIFRQCTGSNDCLDHITLTTRSLVREPGGWKRKVPEFTKEGVLIESAQGFPGSCTLDGATQTCQPEIFELRVVRGTEHLLFCLWVDITKPHVPVPYEVALYPLPSADAPTSCREHQPN